MLQDNRRPRAFSQGPWPVPACDRGQADPVGAPSITLPLAAASPDPGGAGPGGWCFEFGPDPGPLGARRLAALCITGPAPDALVGVLVLHRGQEVFQLGSGRDARGQAIPAGEMLLAMARMQGLEGLLVDAGHLDLTAAGTVLRLQVRGEAGPALPRVTALLAPPAQAQSAS